MIPRVSVLMPVYNGERTLERALSSILGQTMSSLELVAVDDGSDDDTARVLDTATASDSRVKTLRIPRQGIIGALNSGIALCRAPFIARMDADDISHPTRLHRQLEYMQAHPEVSVCSCLVRMFPRCSLQGGLVRYEQWLNSLVGPDQIERDMFVESPVAHPSVLMRTDELLEMGGYQDHGWPEDYDLWLRFHGAGKRFGKVEKALVFWRQTEGRLTFTDPRYSVENFLRAKAHYLCDMLCHSNRPVLLWGAGKTGRRILKHLLRGGLEIEAVIDIDPKKIGRNLRGRPIVAADHLLSRQNAFVIAAVSSHGARELIRNQLRSTGLREMCDFVCAA